MAEEVKEEKHAKAGENQLYEESDHDKFTIEDDFFSITKTKVATPSLFVRRKVPGAYKEIDCQTDLDMAMITRLSDLEKA